MAGSTYSRDVADIICWRLAQGESLRSICRADGMPAEATVRSWVIDDLEGFAAQYARARDIGLDIMAGETLEIADTTQEGVKTKETKDGVEVLTGDMIEHRRLRVDTRKWYLSKLAPKRYGERLDVEHAGSIGVTLNIR